jgi:hypothetical protein
MLVGSMCNGRSRLSGKTLERLLGMRDTPPITAAAVQIQAHALAAIESLTAALDVSRGCCG